MNDPPVVDVLLKVLSAFSIEKISVRIDGVNVTVMFPLDGNWRLSPGSTEENLRAVEDYTSIKRHLRILGNQSGN